MQWIFMLFISHLAAFCTAFSSILVCVLHQNALRFGAKRGAFSSILHCVLHHIALYFAVNSSKCGANGGPFK